VAAVPNPPGAEDDPTLNEPDFADALQAMLAAKGRSLFGEVLGFSRARWYTGARANGSLPGGEVLPEVAHRTHTRNAGASQTSFSVSPRFSTSSIPIICSSGRASPLTTAPVRQGASSPWPTAAPSPFRIPGPSRV
jgi:hypothetical protein